MEVNHIPSIKYLFTLILLCALLLLLQRLQRESISFRELRFFMCIIWPFRCKKFAHGVISHLVHGENSLKLSADYQLQYNFIGLLTVLSADSYFIGAIFYMCEAQIIFMYLYQAGDETYKCRRIDVDRCGYNN